MKLSKTEYNVLSYIQIVFISQVNLMMELSRVSGNLEMMDWYEYQMDLANEVFKKIKQECEVVG